MKKTIVIRQKVEIEYETPENKKNLISSLKQGGQSCYSGRFRWTRKNKNITFPKF